MSEGARVCSIAFWPFLGVGCVMPYCSYMMLCCCMLGDQHVDDKGVARARQESETNRKFAAEGLGGARAAQ